MKTRRIAAKRDEKERVNEEIPPRVEQVLQCAQVPIGGKRNEVPLVPPYFTNGEIREALLALARTMTTRVSRDVGPTVNSLESTMTYRLRDFMRMNPPIFHGSKVGEDPQEFLYGVYKVLSYMGVTSRKKE